MSDAVGKATSDEFMYEGESLNGRCSYCQRRVDNYDETHRVTSIVRGGKGVECVIRGDIGWMEAQPLGPVRVGAEGRA